MLLHEAIEARHSTRLFLSKPVPEKILHDALELATHAPSNSNTQAWRLYMVTGDALARLKTALLAAADAGSPPDHVELPPSLKQSRSILGRKVYGEGWGIAKEDAEGQRAAVLGNYEFFGAPVGAIVCMARDLPGSEALSIGMYLQTFLLALTEQGVDSCAQISITEYREVVRDHVGITDELTILCGVAFGYEDAVVNVNKVRADRFFAEETTIWMRD
jgi:nitroreductase